MRTLNPEHMKIIVDLVNKGYYYALLDMDVEELGAGYSRVRVPVSEKHWNSFGGIHGGAMASILDTAAYWAAYGMIEEGVGYTTLDLNVNCLRSVGGGSILAEGRVIKAGRSIFLAESQIKDDQDRLIATAQSKLFLAPTIQPIEKALEIYMPDVVLPPKFLD